MVTSSTVRTHTTPHEPSLDFAPVILVVDDERHIRELCREVLERDLIRVLTAANGIEALALADRWILDVLVTDVAMPGLDGFGLLRALRYRYPGMAAFVMTGDPDYHGRPVQEVAVEHGVKQTFLKPFDPMHLCEAVQRQCEVSAHFVVAGPTAHRSIPAAPGQARAGSMLAR
jgi:two-component system, chemotaxis family, chemotaxis protein CheY